MGRVTVVSRQCLARLTTIGIVGLVLVGASLVRRSAAHAAMAEAARSFLATLDDGQRARVSFAFDAPARMDWHFVPRDEAGLRTGDMSAVQKSALHALLQCALSSQGYLKVTGIVHLESILHELESTPDRPATGRDPGRYAVAIFGKPGEGPWAWRFEGHHVSVSFTSVEGEFTTHTPFFLGSNPARVQGGVEAGWRVLAVEEDVGRELFTSLDAEQRAKALLAGEVPRDVILGPGRDAGFHKTEGLACADMRAGQRALVERLLHAFIDDLAADLAAAEWARVRQNGIERVRFAWCGGLAVGQPHYWRLHGPHFVIEYDNAQDGANHVHTVWRDLEHDFGGDALKRHLEASHAGSKR